MEANVRSIERSSPSESSRGFMRELTLLLLSITRSAPTNVLACESISERTLSPNEKMATSAAMPITIDEMNRNRRARLRRLSRQAIFSSQPKRRRLLYLNLSTSILLFITRSRKLIQLVRYQISTLDLYNTFCLRSQFQV